MSNVAKRIVATAKQAARGAYELGARIMGRVIEGQALAMEAEAIYGVDFDRKLKPKEYGAFNDAVADKWEERNVDSLPTVDGTRLTVGYLFNADTRKLGKEGRKELVEAVKYWKKKVQDAQADARRNLCDAYAKLPEVRERRKDERNNKPPVGWEQIASDALDKLVKRLTNTDGAPDVDRLTVAQAAFMKALRS